LENLETVPIRELPSLVDCHSPVHPVCALHFHFQKKDKINMRKALIAGATGAIGSVLLELLDDSDQCHHGTRFTGPDMISSCKMEILCIP
jgi:hypothetical protein